MSLRGRYMIDRIKRLVSSRLVLPVPPYGKPEFWDSVYQRMERPGFGGAATVSTDQDGNAVEAFEWGGVRLEHIRTYQQRPVLLDLQGSKEYPKHSTTSDTPLSTTLAETLGVGPRDPGNDDPEEPILMLGCGNSTLGEDMLDHGWNGPMVQVDIASKALEMVARRCQERRHDYNMQFVEDDATTLASFSNNTIMAAMDKGLIDALFCANEYTQIQDILQQIHRVLRPGGCFVVLSFSRPEFVLPQWIPDVHVAARLLAQPQQGDATKTTASRENDRGLLWSSLEIQELDTILLYRFQKAATKPKTIRQPQARRSATSRSKQKQ